MMHYLDVAAPGYENEHKTMLTERNTLGEGIEDVNILHASTPIIRLVLNDNANVNQIVERFINLFSIPKTEKKTRACTCYLPVYDNAETLKEALETQGLSFGEKGIQSVNLKNNGVYEIACYPPLASDLKSFLNTTLLNSITTKPSLQFSSPLKTDQHSTGETPSTLTKSSSPPSKPS